jgi:lipopolysaccharide export system permease protein
VRSKFPVVNIDTMNARLTKEDYGRIYDYALNITRNNIGVLENATNLRKSETEGFTMLIVEWHKKIVVCFACIVLFFVGAPLGAIIRKGGLGLPVVTAVFFFLAYFILTQAFETVALEGKLPPWQAMWIPVLVFLPISIFLTYKAARDSALFDASSYLAFFQKLFAKKT